MLLCLLLKGPKSRFFVYVFLLENEKILVKTLKNYFTFYVSQ